MMVQPQECIQELRVRNGRGLCQAVCNPHFGQDEQEWIAVPVPAYLPRKLVDKARTGLTLAPSA